MSEEINFVKRRFKAVAKSTAANTIEIHAGDNILNTGPIPDYGPAPNPIPVVEPPAAPLAAPLAIPAAPALPAPKAKARPKLTHHAVPTLSIPDRHTPADKPQTPPPAPEPTPEDKALIKQVDDEVAAVIAESAHNKEQGIAPLAKPVEIIHKTSGFNRMRQVPTRFTFADIEYYPVSYGLTWTSTSKQQESLNQAKKLMYNI